VEDMAKENKQKIRKTRIPTDELEKEYQESLEITEAEIQARAEAETAAENIDKVSEPLPARNPDATVNVVDGATQIEPTDDELRQMAEPAAADPDYLEYSAEAVGFLNRQQQWDTYHSIVNYMADGDSILDFGCGRGDFERFYRTEYNNNTDLDYVGIEMNKQLVDASKKAYNGEVDVRCMDWFNTPEELEADWCINVGSNNLRYDADTTKTDSDYLQSTIDKMYSHANKGIIVLLTSDVSEIDDGCVNYNAGDLLNWAQKKYKNVALDHTVSEDLFTIIIYKNEK
jgi:SAM-dependent methyltransferase